MSKRFEKSEMSVSRLLKRALLGSSGVQPLDALESRQLFTVNILNPVADVVVAKDSAATVISLNGRYDNPDLNGTIAKFSSSLGDFNVLLYDSATPITVNNFLRYITEGRYANTMIHRNGLTQAGTPFVVQGGGFQTPTQNDTVPAAVTTFNAIQNEPGISNVRGTIAMAKLSGNANSATSQWFVNTVDNQFLNTSNGGFTVFGRVIGNGMNVVDAIAALPVFDVSNYAPWGANSAFGELPLRNFTSSPIKPQNFVGIAVTTAPEMTYTVTSSNAGLVTATLDGSNLQLAYTAGATGNATVTVRATSADGSFVENAFAVDVEGAPTIAALVTTPTGSVTQGGMLTLTAQNVNDALGLLSKVQFYRDTNGDGVLQPDTDTLLQERPKSSNGYSYRFSTSTLAQGSTRFFARAVRTNGVAGEPVSVVVQIGPPPTVGALNADPAPIPRGGTFNLVASQLTVSGSPFKSADFFVDSNHNGVFDASDKKIGSASKLVGGTVTAKVSSKGLDFGTNTFFARVTDSSGAVGPAKSVAIDVSNANPTLKAVSAKPAVVKSSGDPLVLSVSGSKDVDGKVTRARYYLDVPAEEGGTPNGVLDASDLLIGEIAVPAGGFKFTYTNSALTGVHRFFGTVVDNDGGVSGSSSVDIRYNAPPTIEAFTVTPDAGGIATAFTLSASGVADVGGVIKSVEFFRDVDGDGVYNARIDKSIGKAKFLNGSWSLVVTGKKLPAGQNHLLARASDTDGGLSALKTATVTIS